MSANFTIDLDPGDHMYSTLGIEPQQISTVGPNLGTHVVCELNVRTVEMNRMFYMKLGSTGVESMADGSFNDAECFTEPAFSPLPSIRVSKALTVDGTGNAKPQFQSAEDKSLAAELLRRYANELLGNFQLVNLFENEDDLYNEIRQKDLHYNNKILEKTNETANGRRDASNNILWKPLDIGAANTSPGFLIARIMEQIANSSHKTRLEEYNTVNSVFREENIVPVTDASYTNLLGLDANGSSFLTTLIDTYSGYLIKQSDAISTLNTLTTTYDNANAAHTTALSTYNNLLAIAAAGGEAVTYDQHTAYTTAKNNLAVALRNKNAAMQNKLHYDAMIDGLEDAIVVAEDVDLNKSVLDASGVYVSTTYQLELFKTGDTLSFNVNFYRIGQTPDTTGDPDPIGSATNSPGNGFTLPLELSHTLTIQLNMVDGDPTDLTDPVLSQETSIDTYGLETN